MYYYLKKPKKFKYCLPFLASSNTRPKNIHTKKKKK